MTAPHSNQNKPSSAATSTNRMASWLLTAAIIIPLLSFGAWRIVQPQKDWAAKDQSTTILNRHKLSDVGGVMRPETDLPDLRSASSDQSPYRVPSPKEKIVPTIPTQAPDANPAVASVFEAIQLDSMPERLSPAFLPQAFSQEAFLADPEAYLNVHEPGRVFQSAQPGPGVPVIEVVGDTQHLLVSGESVRLQVRVPAGMPATFSSFDIGTFDNGLATISVAAGEDGVAQATFHASPGKLGEINLLAASPVAAETISFRIYITPDAQANNSSTKPAVR